MKLNPMAAEVLEASAAGYAAAASQVHEGALGRGEAAEEFSRSEWAAHFKQRILELAAAIRVNQPGLFAGQVVWLRRAFEARGSNVASLKSAMMSLRTALQQEFPDDLRPTVVSPIEIALQAFDAELPPDATYLDPDSKTGKLGLEYIAACLAGDPDRGLDLVLAAVEQGLTPADAYTRVLVPVQNEVGQFWHLGEISVAEERLISETTGRLMVLISHLHGGARKDASGPVVVHASVKGNAHDLGLRVICELFRLAGWRCLFLGANVPADEIGRAASLYRADLVVLNATLATQLKELREAIAKINETHPKSAVMVGGMALDETPELWREFGADGYAASVDEAVTLGTSLISH
jgi:methanogenic corrinoid protein MtbC1